MPPRRRSIGVPSASARPIGGLRAKCSNAASTACCSVRRFCSSAPFALMSRVSFARCASSRVSADFMRLRRLRGRDLLGPQLVDLAGKRRGLL